MNWMLSTQEKVMYIFLVGKHESKKQQLYCCVHYLLKFVFVKVQVQFYSDSFPEDQISMFQSMQSFLNGWFGNVACTYLW